MMKKILLLSILSLIANGCATTSISSLEGNWIDKETEFINISFSKSEGVTWMEGYGGKYKIVQSAKGNFVTISKIEYPIVIMKEKEELLIGENAYIPVSNAFKKQFVGIWENSSQNILMKVTNERGGIQWDIKSGDNGFTRYYPKLTKDGFTITYYAEQLFFVLKKGFIEDSNGLKYYKTSKS